MGVEPGNSERCSFEVEDDSNPPGMVLGNTVYGVY